MQGAAQIDAKFTGVFFVQVWRCCGCCRFENRCFPVCTRHFGGNICWLQLASHIHRIHFMFPHSFVIFVLMSRECHVCAPHIYMGYCTDATLTPHSACVWCVTNNTACCTRAATRLFVPVAVVCMRTPRQLCAGTAYKLSHSITDTCSTRAHKLTHVYRQQCAGTV